jgi:hypothetical protein
LNINEKDSLEILRRWSEHYPKEGIKRLAGIRNGKYENEYLMARINPAHTK